MRNLDTRLLFVEPTGIIPEGLITSLETFFFDKFPNDEPIPKSIGEENARTETIDLDDIFDPNASGSFCLVALLQPKVFSSISERKTLLQRLNTRVRDFRDD